MARVSRVRVIRARPEDVWALVGDFDGPWMTLGGKIRMTFDGDPESPGSTRTIHLPGGIDMVEELVSIDEGARRLRYRVPAPFLMIRHSDAQLAVERVNEECSRVVWTADMDLRPAALRPFTHQVAGAVINPMLGQLAKILEEPRDGKKEQG